MGCYLCRGKGVIKQHKGREVCKKCFCLMLEKRIRKSARLEKLFKKGDRILVLGGLNKAVVFDMLKNFPVELFFRKKENSDFVEKNKINKIVIEWTMDDEANEFVSALIYKKRLKKIAKRYVKLLKVITDKEALEFAKIKKISFKPGKKDEAAQLFLNNVERQHPNIKYNLLKNIEKLKKL